MKTFIALLALTTMLLQFDSSENRLQVIPEQKESGNNINSGEETTPYMNRGLGHNPLNQCREPAFDSGSDSGTAFISGKLMNNIYIIF
jgi:hypothetical protein